LWDRKPPPLFTVTIFPHPHCAFSGILSSSINETRPSPRPGPDYDISDT